MTRQIGDPPNPPGSPLEKFMAARERLLEPMPDLRGLFKRDPRIPQGIDDALADIMQRYEEDKNFKFARYLDELESTYNRHEHGIGFTAGSGDFLPYLLPPERLSGSVGSNNSSDKFRYSEDTGNTWISQTLTHGGAGSGYGQDFAFDGERYWFAVGFRWRYSWLSANGSPYSSGGILQTQSTATNGNRNRSIIYNRFTGLYIICGVSRIFYTYTPLDEESWTSVGVSGEAITLGWDGASTYLCLTTSRVYMSNDGMNWEIVKNEPIGGSSISNREGKVIWFNNKWVYFSRYGIWSTVNGVDWTQQETPRFFAAQHNGLAIVAGAKTKDSEDTPFGIWSSTDGNSWDKIALDNFGDCNFIPSWDGNAWIVASSGVVSPVNQVWRTSDIFGTTGWERTFGNDAITIGGRWAL